MSIEQPEEALSSNNLGTEIWETNNSGNRQTQLSVKVLLLMLLRSAEINKKHFAEQTETFETN